jgi:predicted nucleotidyltransferase component of viral defense system
MNVFDQMMSRYEIQTNNDYTNALHEVMQQITLCGLYRGGFFDKAAFYGGTCLRVFHGLERFSEDMDFSLIHEDETFILENYFDAIYKEFRSLGREVTINRKQKNIQSTIESAFLKDDTAVYDLHFKAEHAIKIKIEVDVNPPSGFETEPKLLLLPSSFMTRCYILPDLYAGKMHALLFRSWKNRIKGRDWYDFEWYVRNNIRLNFKHFGERCYQFGSIKNNDLTIDSFKALLKEKIDRTNISMIKADVSPFIKDQKGMDIWSTDYFLQLVDKIRFNE